MPVNNEHRNEIVEESAEEMQDQTTNGTQQVQQEQVAEPVPVVDSQPLRRSTRERKSTISEDFMYMSEGHDMGKVDDPNSFKEAMSSEYSHKWIEAMEEELKSMSTNKVWDLVSCKWVYKTKYDSKGKIKRFKARLVAKKFTQREGINYIKTFSPISKKDSFRIVMALIVHFDLELHQIDDKIAFLNSDLHENVYMMQPEGFVMEGKEQMGCKLKKSIYGLNRHPIKKCN